MSETWIGVGHGVSVPIEAINDGPHVNWRHIDGPMLSWAGQVHWLTWRERLSICLRLTTVDDVAVRRWPYLAKHRAALAHINAETTPA